MKIFLTLAVVLLIVAGLMYMFTSQNTITDTTVSENDLSGDRSGDALTPYTSESMGLSFAYKSGADGYTIIQPENMGNEIEDFVDGIVLIRTNDYEDMQNGPDRGGPPAITMRAFDAPDTELVEWLEANNYFTNYQAEQVESITVGDVEGVKYSWEGMFSGETVAVFYRGRVYVFEGTYSDREDQGLTDFRDLLETVLFTTPEQMTITGTYDCLGEDAIINPPSESCQRGIRTIEGQTYVLDLMLMSQTPPPLQTGETITVFGVFTSTERMSASQWADLGVEGILSVTTLTKESE